MLSRFAIVLLSGCVVGEIGEPTPPTPPGGSPEDPTDPDQPDPDPGNPDDPGNPMPPAGAQGVVVGYPGGKSIAIRWTAIAGASSYSITRDGSPITTQPFNEVNGNGAIDASVTPGVAYTYRVTANTGDLVGETTLTLPTNTTPEPALTIDTSQAPDLAPWMNNTVKPFLLTWYPKIGDIYARPDYVPPHALTLTIDPNYDGVAYCDGQHIVMAAKWAREHPEDVGGWLHEATHAMQSYQNIPGWITEGMADYSREFILHDRAFKKPGPGNTYKTGYSEGSYFLAWIRSNYDPTIIHAVNVAAHGGTYTDNFFVQKTGKSIDALWTEMTGSPPPAPIRFTGLTNKCLKAGDPSTNNVLLATCADDVKLGFGVIHNANNTISIANGNSCIDVAASGTANGTTIWMYTCNGSAAQQWVQQSNGTLKNPASGRCLDNPNASTTDGTAMRLWDCNNSSAQKLSTLP